MSVISLKEYAKTHNISYEAVRKQVARFQEELSGHIIEDGGQRFLDDAAVEFLDNRRDKNPVVFANDSAKAELEAAKTALEQMKFECAKRDGQIELLKQQLNENFGAAALLEAAKKKERDLQSKNEILARENVALIEQAESDRATADLYYQKAADLERRAIEARQRETEAAVALEKAEAEIETLSDVAEMNAQEAEKAKAEAAELKVKLEKLQSRNLWQRIFNKE